MPVDIVSETAAAEKQGKGALVRTLATASTRLLDLPFRYGLHFLIAARLGIADVGAFYIVFSVMTMASGFGRLGVDRATTREVAAAMGLDLPNAVRKVVRRSFMITLMNSGIITAALVLLSKPVAVYILHKPALAIPMAIGAISIMPQNLANAAAGALAGLGRVATSQMIYAWLWPGLFCIAALTVPLTVNRTLLLIVASMTVSAILGIVLMLRILPERHPDGTTIEQPSLFKLGAQLFSMELLQLAISSAPPFVLGIVASTTEVGRYAVAWRIVLLLNLLVSAMAAVASPAFARAFAIGDHDTLRRTARQAVGVCTGLAILPVILLAINPVFFLSFLGKAYAPAAPALRILLIGQMSLILCAAVPEMLGMTGYAKKLLNINMVSLVVLLAGLAAFTPRYGDVGAAGGTALAMIVSAIAVSYAAKRDLGVIPLVNVVQDGYAQLLRTLRPATASDSPSLSDIHDIDNV
jgi:O-antigen/teichoic acid export membrane protein